tara:strand:- start:976 stop:1731 length:756 start_codon:yes stop_codon:yes gene_type:complete
MMPSRTGDIQTVTINQVLEDLDIVVGEDFAMGDFDVLGWQLAAKVRERGSHGYNHHGALFRPNYERGILVHSLIQKKGLVKILEIGFGRGYVTTCAANAIYGKGINGEVTTVDPFFDQQKLDNFSSVLDPAITSMVKINTMGQTSDHYFDSLHPKARFDFIFIDGDHRYDSVRKDYENAVKHIDRGYILMDDYHMPTKVEKDIDVSNFVDSLPSSVERKLVLTDRLLFNDDRGKTSDDLDYGMVLIPVGDI